MMTNRKALQTRIVRLETAVKMREAVGAKIHVLHIAGHWQPNDTAENCPDLAAAHDAARAAYEVEHGPIGEYDTEIFIQYVENTRHVLQAERRGADTGNPGDEIGAPPEKQHDAAPEETPHVEAPQVAPPPQVPPARRAGYDAADDDPFLPRSLRSFGL